MKAMVTSVCLGLLLAAGSSPSAAPAGAHVLPTVHSSRLDELRVGDTARLQSRILIAPVEVAFHRDWMRDMARSPGRLQRVSPSEAARLADDVATSLHKSLADALRQHGFEVVTAPGPQVTVLSPSVSELYVNAPDLPSSAMVRQYVREAVHATLRIDARDASGAALLSASDRESSGDMGTLQRAGEVSNRFWVDAMLGRWAGEVAAELGARRPR
jgi:hypothetical protein